jgi:hypothetical protein
VSDCDRLLTAPAPKYLKADPTRLEGKKFDAWKCMADVEARCGRFGAAKRHYGKAAKKYWERGERDKAIHAEIDIARLDAPRNLDGAVQRIRELLESVPAKSLERAEILVSLGEVYCGVTEDHEALRHFKQAEKALVACGHKHLPQGQEIAEALSAMLLSDNIAGPDGPKFGDQNAAASLYRRIYRGFEEIYRRQGKVAKANEYLAQIEDSEGSIRDGSKSNLDFTNTMLTNLDAIMKKLSE